MPTITDQRPGQHTEVPAWDDPAPDIAFMSFNSVEHGASFDQVAYLAPPGCDAIDIGFMSFGSVEHAASLDQVAYSAPAS